MNRKEHVQWCKDRALEILDKGGEGQEAFASMMTDMNGHDETRANLGLELGTKQMLMPGWLDGRGLREWIEGFN